MNHRPNCLARRSRLPAPRRAHALSIIELLAALSITALLLTATMVALDASFKAYADVAAQSSAQVATRMVVDNLLALLRTSTAQGPLDNDSTVTPPAVLSGNTITSPYIELIDATGNLDRIQYNSTTQQLLLTITPVGSATSSTQPILGGVTAATFYNLRQLNNENIWELARSTMDITVTPGADATLSLEETNAAVTPIRVIASTMPRKNPS